MHLSSTHKLETHSDVHHSSSMLASSTRAIKKASELWYVCDVLFVKTELRWPLLKKNVVHFIVEGKK